MAKKIPHKKDERSSKIILSDNQLRFFYKIIVYCESDDINNTEFRIDYKSLKTFFSSSPAEDKIVLETHSKKHPLDFGISSPLNTFKLKLTYGKGKGKSFLIHLRNCFAHNRITVAEDGTLGFMDIKNQKVTMTGKIRFEKLKEAVEAILEEAYKD